MTDGASAIRAVFALLETYPQMADYRGTIDTHYIEQQRLRRRPGISDLADLFTGRV